MLINYPFFKIVCNRAFHLARQPDASPRRVRDVSNNLKLYRADILKTLDIEEPHFAANMETGLKPLLAGYDIEEVPVSWINRTVGMGTSSFRIVRVAPGYFGALMRTIWRVWRGRPTLPGPAEPPVRARVRRCRTVTFAARTTREIQPIEPPGATMGELLSAVRWANRLTLRIERSRVLPFVRSQLLYSDVHRSRSRLKPMWNDELYTYYIARLPSMNDVWAALMSRGEQTPPFFYIADAPGDSSVRRQQPVCPAARDARVLGDDRVPLRVRRAEDVVSCQDSAPRHCRSSRPRTTTRSRRGRTASSSGSPRWRCSRGSLSR